MMKEMMTDEERFFAILAKALIEMRARAYERGDKVTFHICDVLHNAPLSIVNNIRNGREHGYSDVLSVIDEKAAQKGISEYFEKT
jgi:hypothetical protein